MNGTGQDLNSLIQQLMEEAAAQPRAPRVALRPHYLASAKLDSELDEVFERMQTKRAREGIYRAFHATAEQLGAAAVRAAHKHG